MALTTCTKHIAPREFSIYEHADRRFYRALNEATERANQIEMLEVNARYNPVSCECPSWELDIGGVWQRARLENEQLETNVFSPNTILIVTINETSELFTSENGWNYAVFEVETFKFQE